MAAAALLLALAPAPTAATEGPFPECNVGPTHHGFLALPLAATEQACAAPGAKFFLTHGATFFCPHAWDVKLLAAVAEDDARAALCESYFGALAAGGAPTHMVRPTLPPGGLPATALGQVSSWVTPAIYHVHSFGKNNSAGITCVEEMTRRASGGVTMRPRARGSFGGSPRRFLASDPRETWPAPAAVGRAARARVA